MNDKKIVDMDTLYLQKICNKLLEKHTVSQIQTMNRCLSNCFKYAITINKIKHNPVEGIVYPKNHDVVEEKVHYISEDNQKALIEALQGDE